MVDAQVGTPAVGDHQSIAPTGGPAADHTLWNGSMATTQPPPEYVDDEPGETCPVAETVPGFDAFPLSPDAPDDLAGQISAGIAGAAPWAWIARIAVTYTDGSTATYSGWLASPRVVGTCGLCLFDPSRGAAKEATVELAAGVVGATRRSLVSKEFRIVQGWAKETKPECDYGAIVLPDKGFADIGHFGLVWLPGSRPRGEPLNLAGYAADRAEGLLWFETFHATDVGERILHRMSGFHSSPAGAPIWLCLSRGGRVQRFVCGLVGSNVDRGDALRLHRDIYSNFRAWVEEAAKSPPASPIAPPAPTA
ncbi:MAG: hypothetical protein KF904_18595 [Rhodoblastus sp.]|nr:hypothetical protein [Rhodoblastus sp.]MCC2099871.1 hypothetical protein [Hyphomicrobiales bacterium]MCC2111288.1 hypothetical protein [Hyphomicrobiales bacterium]